MGLDFDNWDRVALLCVFVVIPILLFRVFVYYKFLKDKIKTNHVGFSFNKKQFYFNIGRFFDSIILTVIGPIFLTAMIFMFSLIRSLRDATEGIAYFLGLLFLVMMVALEFLILKKFIVEKKISIYWLYIKIFLVTTVVFFISAIVLYFVLNLFLVFL